jgi:hypothetical protein
MSVITLHGLVGVSDNSFSVYTAVIKSVFHPMRPFGRLYRQLPQDHLADSNIRIDEFLVIDHLVFVFWDLVL